MGSLPPGDPPGLLKKKTQFKDFPESNKGWVHLTWGRMMFQKASARAEKAHLLRPFRWNFFTDGTQNMPLLPELMGQVDVWEEKKWSLR